MLAPSPRRPAQCWLSEEAEGLIGLFFGKKPEGTVPANVIAQEIINGPGFVHIIYEARQLRLHGPE